MCVSLAVYVLQLQARETSQLKLLAAEQQRREEEREGQFRKRVEEYSRLESELKAAILDFRKQQDQLRWATSLLLPIPSLLPFLAAGRRKLVSTRLYEKLRRRRTK